MISLVCRETPPPALLAGWGEWADVDVSIELPISPLEFSCPPFLPLAAPTDSGAPRSARDLESGGVTLNAGQVREGSRGSGRVRGIRGIRGVRGVRRSQRAAEGVSGIRQGGGQRGQRGSGSDQAAQGVREGVRGGQRTHRGATDSSERRGLESTRGRNLSVSKRATPGGLINVHCKAGPGVDRLPKVPLLRSRVVGKEGSQGGSAGGVTGQALKSPW